MNNIIIITYSTLVISLSDPKKTSLKSSTLADGKSVKDKGNKERRHIPSASTALIVGGILGLVQAMFLIFGAKPLLSIMGVKSVSAFPCEFCWPFNFVLDTFFTLPLNTSYDFVSRFWYAC